MSATTDQVLTVLERRALDQGVPLDGIDEFMARRLELPVAALYAYLRVCFAAERYLLTAGAETAVPVPPGGAKARP